MMSFISITISVQKKPSEMIPFIIEKVMLYISKKVLYWKHLYIIIILFLSVGSIYGQKPKKLFRSDSVLELTITLPLKDVIFNNKERIEHNSKLSYTKADGTVTSHLIKVKVRGKTRANKQICSFPPLQLRFNKSDTENSIFKDQKKVKLVAHCQNDRNFENYVQIEYLVYKLYQLISPYSFNVRLCRITYIDQNRPDQENIHYGILIESISDLAKRNDMKVFKGNIRNQEAMNKENLDKLVFFQFMIGNLDWSITERHNMKLIKGEKGALPIAVPYDFDYSGIINTPYAVPPEELHLPDVKTRLFRGFCRRNKYQETIDFYKSIKDDLFAEVNQVSTLNGKSVNSVTKYLESFFEILESDKYIDKKIIRACKVNHQHAYENVE